MTYKIRLAEHRDIDNMIELGGVMHQEGSYQWLPYDKAKLQKLAQNLLGSDNGCIWLAESESGTLLGFYVVYKARCFFCDEHFASDYLLYVDPEARNNHFIAIRLIRKALIWAKENGCREFRPGSTVDIARDRVEKLYNFMKFDTVGHTFTKRM